MTSIVCFCDYCKWHDENCECNRGNITINNVEQVKNAGADEDYGCDCYEDYRDSYNDSFWQAIRKEGKPHRRLIERGKKIEHNGYVFYTTDKITESGNYFLTEERTGLGVCLFNELEKRWDKFLERVGTYPDVMTYPEKATKIAQGLYAEWLHERSEDTE